MINYANGHAIASISDKTELQSILGVSYKTCYVLARKETKDPLSYFNAQLDGKMYHGSADEKAEEFQDNPYIEKEGDEYGEKDIYAVDEYGENEDSPVTQTTEETPTEEALFAPFINGAKTV